MALAEFGSLSYIVELSKKLSSEVINQLISALNVPEGICLPGCSGTYFLSGLKRWPEFDSDLFSDALKLMQPGLLNLVKEIDWLCHNKHKSQDQAPTVENLIKMLKNELSNDHLKLICMSFLDPTFGTITFESTIQYMYEKGSIKNDLSVLSRILDDIELNIVAKKLDPYRQEFMKISEFEFGTRISNEIKDPEGKIRLLKNFNCPLKSFLEKFRVVERILGNGKPLNFDKVYVSLTILKQMPRYVSVNDETTYRDIAYIMKIANEQAQITPIEFSEEMRSCNPYKPGIWCIIGNVGSGKTFLCHRIVLEYVSNELPAFSYTIYIHYQDQRWYDMESSRIDKDLRIDPEFIRDWLYLGLPAHIPELANDITDEDGLGLLLIIDGLNQFTDDNNVPFNKTLLYLLLTRQALSRSHIILTSRPGAWTDISTSYQLQITYFYHVLGFSPAQRDQFFEKQFDDASVRKRFTNILDRYNEMEQLSLIPINAAFFSSLVNSDDVASIRTLTQFYYRLTLHLICRQLSEIGQEEIIKPKKISELDSDTLDCLGSIGFMAYQGVGLKERIFDKKFGQVRRSGYCLGLVHEYVREDRFGILTKVWAFPHHSLQEFTGAIWLSRTSWWNQCLSVRYIVHTDDVFSRFRMSLRFLCGLSESIYVLDGSYRHLIPRPIPIKILPDCVQLRLETSDLFKYTGWEEFSVRFIQLCEILFESDLGLIHNSFKICKRYLPRLVCLYIINKVQLNEWNCLLKMFPFLKYTSIHVIYVAGDYVSADQLLNLFNAIKECNVSSFVLELRKKNNEEVLAYIKAVRTQLPKNTKLTLKLDSCELNEKETFETLYSLTNKNIILSLSLYRNDFHHSSLSLLEKQISTCRNLEYVYTKFDFDALISALSSTECTYGLHLHCIPIAHHEQLFSLLRRLTNIRELTWDACNPYSILPFIVHLTTLDYLELRGFHITDNVCLSNDLLKFVHANRVTIRVLKLNNLGINIGFECLDGFIKILMCCSKLIQLNLEKTRISCDDANLWFLAVSRLTSLLQLKFNHVSLGNEGLLSLCKGLVCHPSVVDLELSFCDLDSESCFLFNNLIPTLKQLKSFSANQISEPNPQNIAQVKSTSDRLAVEHELH